MPAPDPFVIDRRFTGPPASGNGGYVAGRLAALVGPGTSRGSRRSGATDAPGGAVAVTLRQPPPLDTPMVVVPAGGPSRPPGTVQAQFGGVVIADAAPATLDVHPVEPVPYDAAVEISAGYRGYTRHPFPTCFVCGTARPAPDGLGLRPGPVADRAPGAPVTACAWVPDASLLPSGRSAGAPAERSAGAPAERSAGEQVGPEFVWAALDCPGGWTVDLAGRPAVLGRITASVDALPYVGDRCVVMGTLLGLDGRKVFTGSTLYDGDGRVLGRARATWITVDPAMLKAH